ncbi:MAG: GFA family protein [Halofilum sp. (in: g-proteobacteria)]|nr:GFA family protein [Halofilum sp. (in: g-proteobacteria)]
MRIELPDRFDFMGYCHCSECRKWSGSAFNAGGMVDADEFEITAGKEFVSRYHKTDETDLGFCSHCGSSLFSHKLQRGKYIVRLGILDDVPSQRPQAHIFVGSKAPWHEITDDLAQHDTVPQ